MQSSATFRLRRRDAGAFLGAGGEQAEEGAEEGAEGEEPSGARQQPLQLRQGTAAVAGLSGVSGGFWGVGDGADDGALALRSEQGQADEDEDTRLWGLLGPVGEAGGDSHSAALLHFPLGLAAGGGASMR